MTLTDLEDVRVVDTPTSPLLGRHVVHDRRSRAYALADDGIPDRRIMWQRNGPVYDQNVYDNGLGGQGLGCCTACAAYGLLMTTPFDRGRVFTDQEVRDLYSLETRLDETVFPGVWPTTDTGSSGLWMMKALRRQGHITGYRHAFSVRAALSALKYGPIAVGTLWLESMFEPDRRGVVDVDPRSADAGGHEYIVQGFDPTGRSWVLIANSWGEHWGRFSDGTAWVDLASFAYLLSRHGDAVQPVLA